MDQKVKFYRKIEFWAVLGLMGLGAFLRFFQLKETAMFQGDQGRDAIIVKRLIKEADFPLIGPVTSVGNMYLGPFYYYFMAPFLALTYPDPIGPVYGVAGLSILAIGLTYLLGKMWFKPVVGWLAALIMAIMGPVVAAGRFSWNPNPAPFFTLITLLALTKWLKQDEPKWLTIAFTATAILTQLHYVNLVMLLWLLGVICYRICTNKPEKRIILGKWTGLGLLIYGLSWLPLVAFNIKHQGLIFEGFRNFFFSPEEHLQPFSQAIMVIGEIEGRLLKLMTQIMGSRSYTIDRLLTYGSGALMVWWWRKKWIKPDHRQFVGLIGSGILATAFGTAWYQGTVFDHYILFAVPFTALWWGFVIWRLWQQRLILIKAVALVVVIGFVGINLANSPAFQAGPSMSRYREVALSILPHLQPQGKYNLVLLAENKDYKGMNYRYFLEASSHPPLSYDNYRDLDQLVVIDEVSVPDPLSVKIYEIQEPKLTHLKNMYGQLYKTTVYIYE